MGKAGKKFEILKVNTKQMSRKQLACYEELHAFLTCLGRSGTSVDTNCMPQIAALTACADAAAKQQKAGSTLNYHLQRLSKFMRRK